MPSMIMGIANCWCLFVNDYTENAKFSDFGLENAKSIKQCEGYYMSAAQQAEG